MRLSNEASSYLMDRRLLLCIACTIAALISVLLKCLCLTPSILSNLRIYVGVVIMGAQLFSITVAFLKDNFIGVLLGGAFLAGYVIWKVSAWKTSMESDRSTLKTGFASLEKTLTDFMQEIRTDVKEIFLRLPAETARSSSPITLTELGQQIAEEIKVDTWLNEYTEKVQKGIQPDTNPYEIQEACFRYADEQFMEDLTAVTEINKAVSEIDKSAIKADIELSAYNHGLPLDKVLRVVGVKLRDNILRNFNLPAPE